jgi:photosynthetic reaction center cytochrome c subunit
VLGDVDANEFIRLMGAITEWVSPEQGCAYCHSEEEAFSDDSLYTKRVSRRMLEMTRAINAQWSDHVGATGVNCYTCHRGNPVPAEIWFTEPENPQTTRMVGNPAGQNRAGELSACRRSRAIRSRRSSSSSPPTSGSSPRRRCRPATAARSSRPNGPTA